MVGMGSSLAMTTLPDQTGVPPERAIDCAELVRLHPWAATSLGPAEAWDPVVRATVDMLLASPVPMVLAYGDDHVLIYNDAYAEVLGARHPAALGRPAADVFGELWHTPGVGGVIADVYRTGQPFLEAETQVAVARGGAGHVEQASFTRGHSVIRDLHGVVAGVLTVAAETTQVTRRLQSLGDLTARLASALTIDDVARVVLAYAMTSFDVDHCVFAVDDGAEFRYVRRIRGEMMDEADERLPPLWKRFAPDPDSPMVTAAQTGRPTFQADGAPLAKIAQDRHERRIRALAAMPLRTPLLRGALTMGYRTAHTWLPAERALLYAAAELVAQAAERARRFEAQHGTAQLLQRSMLPEHLPELDRFRIAARYDVGVDGNAAGGDFYDAFELSDGRLAMVLGDVAGHDVRAAAVMGQVRAALRALALTDPAPGTVLAGLDRLVGSLGAESR
ncbi:SpoIIE family protein phosphatase, partial [Actinoplanes sp. NPDC048791]|uniref:SpoIIE family protein phosphatase n=1 Tax=Actinoplanes sp. NPDC048791 TaxID=3154623 RepID=UPI0033FD0DC5